MMSIFDDRLELDILFDDIYVTQLKTTNQTTGLKIN